MGLFGKYPKYETTQIPWIGDVPTTWKVRRLKEVGRLFGGAGFPHEFQNLQGEELYFYKVGDLSLSENGRTLLESPHSISRETAKTLRAAVIPKDAIVYAKIGAALLLNRRRITTAECCIDNNMTAYVTNCEHVSPEWAFYWLSTLDFGEHVNPGAVPSFSEGYQSVLPIPVPPIDEQQAIARFLDFKTAQIDALITKKQTLLDKLAEKRTALISHAVTKGLDPQVRMKDSGVAWLGQIPAHWQRLLLVRVIRRCEQGWSPACEEREASLDEWGVLKSGCVNYGEFDEFEHKTLPSSISPIASLEVKAGDILMCRASGSKHLIGSVARVHSCRPQLLFSDKTYRIALDENLINPDFFVLAMKSKYMRDQIGLSISGADGLANNIPQASVKSYQLVLPVISEQQVIAKVLGSEMERSTQQEKKIKAVITKLQEYRSALITNAVTGKIDVRGFQIPPSTREPAHA